MGRLTENSVLVMKNKSFWNSPLVEVPWKRRRRRRSPRPRWGAGVQIFAKAGRAKFAYNFFGLQTFTTDASQLILAGKHQVRMEFAYDGGGLAKGGKVSLYYDGKKVGEGRVERTVPMLFSEDETTDVGRDTATPVSSDYTRKTSVFNREINWVQINLGKDDHDHIITPERRAEPGHVQAVNRSGISDAAHWRVTCRQCADGRSPEALLCSFESYVA